MSSTRWSKHWESLLVRQVTSIRYPLSISAKYIYSPLPPVSILAGHTFSTTAITSRLLSVLILPGLNAPASPSNSNATSRTKPHLAHLSVLFQTLLLLLSHLQRLVESPHIGMSDDIIIQIVYIAVGPFFVGEVGSGVGVGGAKGKATEKKVLESALAAVGGESGLRGLRLDALGLVRAVSSCYYIQGREEDKRKKWIR